MITEKELDKYWGKRVKIICDDGWNVTGKPYGFTDKLNDPAEKDVLTFRSDRNGLYEIYLENIKEVIILND